MLLLRINIFVEKPGTVGAFKLAQNGQIAIL